MVLQIELGHWFSHLDEKYGMTMEKYYGCDIEETAQHFYELGRIELLKEIREGKYKVADNHILQYFND